MTVLAAWIALASPAPALALTPASLPALAPASAALPTPTPASPPALTPTPASASAPAPLDTSQAPPPPHPAPRTPPSRPRRARLQPLPAARALFGAALPAAPTGPPAFAFDLALGTQITGPRDLGLASELGYTLLHRGDHLDHRFGLGLGPLYRGQSGSAGLLARGLVGSAGGELIGGLRLALIGGFARDLIAFEIGQEWTWGGPGPTRALRLGVGLNLVQIFGAALGISIVRAMTPRGRRWW